MPAVIKVEVVTVLVSIEVTVVLTERVKVDVNNVVVAVRTVMVVDGSVTVLVVVEHIPVTRGQF